MIRGALLVVAGFVSCMIIRPSVVEHKFTTVYEMHTTHPLLSITPVVRIA